MCSEGAAGADRTVFYRDRDVIERRVSGPNHFVW